MCGHGTRYTFETTDTPRLLIYFILGFDRLWVVKHTRIGASGLALRTLRPYLGPTVTKDQHTPFLPPTYNNWDQPTPTWVVFWSNYRQYIQFFRYFVYLYLYRRVTEAKLTPRVGIICIVPLMKTKWMQKKLKPVEQFESFNIVPLYFHLNSGVVNIAIFQRFWEINKLLPLQCCFFLILLEWQ